jgi:hypothetical protein
MAPLVQLATLQTFRTVWHACMHAGCNALSIYLSMHCEVAWAMSNRVAPCAAAGVCACTTLRAHSQFIMQAMLRGGSISLG